MQPEIYYNCADLVASTSTNMPLSGTGTQTGATNNSPAPATVNSGVNNAPIVPTFTNNQASCAPGTYQCTSNGFLQCTNGNWVEQMCPTGLVCVQKSPSSVLCDQPTHTVLISKPDIPTPSPAPLEPVSSSPSPIPVIIVEACPTVTTVTVTVTVTSCPTEHRRR